MWALVKMHMRHGGIGILWVNLNSINLENATKIIEIYDYSSREDLDANLKVAPIRKNDKIRFI